jgi:chemotaxis protein methyltransferase CheR
MAAVDLENLELDLLLEGVFRCYGYDFRNYARASLKRRVQHRMKIDSIESCSELLTRVLHDREHFDRLLQDLSISVTEFFRDPAFYRSIRETVVPVLRTFAFTKIWHAGCATGEEAYSMAILLAEEGLLSRTRIYATDYNNACLETARQAIYPTESIESVEERYRATGGNGSLHDYFSVGYGALKIRDDLRRPILFAHHNLASDRSFGEMNLVICRNVLIYFDANLQGRVLRLLDESLCRRGFLGIGPKESLRSSNVQERFEPIANVPSLFRRKD